jgi:hypothetical protein
MIPAGYMAKRLQTPKGFHIGGVADVYSVSDCVNADFADYIPYWKHNGYWLFDSPQVIRTAAQENSVQLDGTSLFYYEAYEMEFDGKVWSPFESEPSIPTNVIPPQKKVLEGFDVVTFYARNVPEHSPLSCNGLAKEIPTNQHCLLESFAEAHDRLNGGAFNNAEPGPYRIFAVYSVDWPESGD